MAEHVLKEYRAAVRRAALAYKLYEEAEKSITTTLQRVYAQCVEALYPDVDVTALRDHGVDTYKPGYYSLYGSCVFHIPCHVLDDNKLPVWLAEQKEIVAMKRAEEAAWALKNAEGKRRVFRGEVS